jgi:hypothetical protein
MSEVTFDAYPEECPSELKLDQLELGALSEAEAKELDAHMTDCSSCKAVMEQRALRASHMNTVDRQAMLSNIVEAVQISAVVSESSQSWWKRWTDWVQLAPARNFAMAGAAMAACLFFLNTNTQEPTNNETIRIKGTQAPTLHVYRERSGKVIQVMQDDVLKSGDRLRFSVAVAKANGEFMIVGVEATGTHFAYYPTGSDRSSKMTSVNEAAALDATVELDESKGREGIYMVWCPEAFTLDSIKRTSDQKGVRVSKRCESTGIEVIKE